MSARWSGQVFLLSVLALLGATGSASASTVTTNSDAFVLTLTAGTDDVTIDQVAGSFGGFPSQLLRFTQAGAAGITNSDAGNCQTDSASVVSCFYPARAGLTVQPGVGNDETVGTPDAVNMDFNTGKALRFVAPPAVTKRFSIVRDQPRRRDRHRRRRGLRPRLRRQRHPRGPRRRRQHPRGRRRRPDQGRRGRGRRAQRRPRRQHAVLRRRPRGRRYRRRERVGDRLPARPARTRSTASRSSRAVPAADNLTFQGFGGGGTLRGGGGADALTLTTAGTIFGGAGADTITGSGSDTRCGAVRTATRSPAGAGRTPSATTTRRSR